MPTSLGRHCRISTVSGSKSERNKGPLFAVTQGFSDTPRAGECYSGSMTATSIQPYQAAVVENCTVAMRQHRHAAHRLGIVHLGGRPTKYHDRMAELAYYVLVDDRIVASLNYVAAMLNISRSTLFEWRQKYEDFARAIEWGKAVQECQLATRMVYGGGDPRGIMFCLKNLHGWRDEPRQKRESFDIAALIQEQATGARRVQWDKARPAHHGLHPQSRALKGLRSGWEGPYGLRRVCEVLWPDLACLRSLSCRASSTSSLYDSRTQLCRRLLCQYLRELFLPDQAHLLS